MTWIKGLSTIAVGLAFLLSAAPAEAAFVASDFIVFTAPGTFLTTTGVAGGPAMDIATFVLTYRCGGPGGASPGILLCFAFPESGPAGRPAIAVPGVGAITETDAAPPGPALTDASILTLPAVPAGPGPTVVQVTEVGDANKLSDALTMAFPRVGANARRAAYAFWSDAVNEPAVAPNPLFATMTEMEGTFQDVSTNLFPALGGAGQPAFPYRVWMMSDCGSTTQQVCMIDVIDEVPEPSTWHLLVAGLAGYICFRKTRKTL